MIRHSKNGLSYYTFAQFQGYPVGHAVLTRNGGQSQPPFASLNVGHSVGDDLAAVGANLQAILVNWGLQRGAVVTAKQVHSNGVAVVGRGDGGKVLPATDGLATDEPGLVLFLRFADCVPIFLYDPRHQAVALGHAGWRGIIAGLATRMMQSMEETFATSPDEIIAALGPAIGPCCYVVGKEVAEQVKAVLPDQGGVISERSGQIYLNLWEAISQQLRVAGVKQIESGEMCTADNTLEFFSHRREKGRTGRFASLIWREE